MFFPENEKLATQKTREQLRKELQKREWGFQERTTRFIRTPGGGLIEFAEARDVVAAYRDAHRSKVAILSTGKSRFSTEDPSERSIRRNTTLKLFGYYQYKAYCQNMSENKFVPDSFFGDFEEWMEKINCDGDPDPRCLPFPIFRTKTTFDNLECSERRGDFEGVHHTCRGREDALNLNWEINPRAFHSRDTLVVAGKALTTGFHWDVQNNARGAIRLSSPTETWEIMSYANIFPDGTIIGRQPYARKIVRK